MKKIYFMLAIAGIFAGCVPSANSATKNSSANSTPPSQDVIVQKVDKDDVRDIIREEKMLAPDASETELSFTAVGEGIAPMNTVSTAQALALAKRAAITDAYRQLASKLYGVKVNGLIKNASIIDENFNQGLYRVNLELKIDADKWKELFAY